MPFMIQRITLFLADGRKVSAFCKATITEADVGNKNSEVVGVIFSDPITIPQGKMVPIDDNDHRICLSHNRDPHCKK